MHRSRLQPLTLNHVTRGQHEPGAAESSDSDSGITVDSSSPPSRLPPDPHHPHTPPNHHYPHHRIPSSKTTPDSGVGLEESPPSWPLPPPPESLLDLDPTLNSDPTMTSVLDPRAAVTVAAPPSSTGPITAAFATRNEEERRRQQEYVRNTLLQYERQKMLQEEQFQRRRAGSNSSSQDDAVGYDHDDILEVLEADAHDEGGYSTNPRPSASHATASNSNNSGVDRNSNSNTNSRNISERHIASSAAERLQRNTNSAAGSYVRKEDSSNEAKRVNVYSAGGRYNSNTLPSGGSNNSKDLPSGGSSNANALPSRSSSNAKVLTNTDQSHAGHSGRTVGSTGANDFYSGNYSASKDKLSKFYHSDNKTSNPAAFNKNSNTATRDDVQDSNFRPPGPQNQGVGPYPAYNKPLPPPPQEGGRSREGGRLEGLTTSQRRAVPNDYVPSRMVDKMRHSDDDVKTERDVSMYVTKAGGGGELRDGYRSERAGQYGEDLQQCRDELSKKLNGGQQRDGDGYPQDGYPHPAEVEEVGGGGVLSDDGYGTADSRSSTNTATSSISSPLSSSLSSLTTDSSSSLNGSQRLSAFGNGSGGSNGGSARSQPVAGGGRLSVGRRPMLVKRRDLAPVEIRSDYGASLEERLRALTTIEEEDPAASSSSSASASKTPPAPPKRDGSRLESSARPGPDYRPRSGSGSRAGQGDEGQGYEEGLYCSISKTQPPRPSSAPTFRRPLPGGAGHGNSGNVDQSTRDTEDPSARRRNAPSPNLHRAVPVRVEPKGDPQRPGPNSTAGNNDNAQEVRFKAGGGGVKLTEGGRFEIDYSYYLKASPSESNDEVNTYSPDNTMADMDVEVFEGEVRAANQQGGGADYSQAPPTSWDQRHEGGVTYNQAPPPESSRRGEDGGNGSYGRTTPSGSSRVEFDYNMEVGQMYMHVQPRGAGGPAGLRQGGVMSSMPNLSLHPPPPRRHSGDTDYYRGTRRHSGEAELHRTNSGSGPHGANAGGDSGPHSGGFVNYPDGQSDSQSHPPPPYRRNPAPGSGYPAGGGGRRVGQGERNSCDVGSLYRQADLSQTFPPSQGVVADRMSLNLGDLPRIHEQLRATSEMLLSTGKRHQFASSSDIYKLFQGQQQQRQQAMGFQQGRQPPHRHSFHNFNSAPQPMQNLSDVRSRVRGNGGGGQPRPGIDQSQGATSPTSALHAQGPVRADHNINVPEQLGYSQYGGGVRDSRHAYSRDGNVSPRDVNLSPRDVNLSPRDANISPRDANISPRDVNFPPRDANLSPRDVTLSPRDSFASTKSDASQRDPRSMTHVPARDGRTTPFRERLTRGEQFATDVIHDNDGEKLSTLV